MDWVSASILGNEKQEINMLQKKWRTEGIVVLVC